MSEYWVSHKKYYCTYCKIYISDDAPSKQQHENGLRHKGNRERYIRSLYKTSEKRKHDLEEEKREISRIDQAAQAAFAQDVGSGIAAAAGSSRPTPSTSTSTTKAVAAQKPSSPWANYTTAASLGYTDPDAERMQAEAERRQTQGVAGEWEVVSVPTPSNQEQHTKSRKREADTQDDDDEDGRRFRLRKKTIGVGLGQAWDPEVIPIKLKAKKEEEPDEAVKVEEKDSEQNRSPQLKWTSRGWKRPGESYEPVTDSRETPPAPASPQEATFLVSHDNTQGPPDIKEEMAAVQVSTKVETNVKSEELTELASTDGGGSMFRKRKLGGTSRGRR